MEDERNNEVQHTSNDYGPEISDDIPEEVTNPFIDARLSGVQSAKRLAEDLRRYRTHVDEWTRTRGGLEPEEIDWADAEALARDVATRTVDATTYEETETVPAGETREGVEVYQEETRYIVVIAGADTEIVIHEGRASIHTRPASPVPERGPPEDSQMTLAEPPTYEDETIDDGGDDPETGLGADLVADEAGGER